MTEVEPFVPLCELLPEPVALPPPLNDMVLPVVMVVTELPPLPPVALVPLAAVELVLPPPLLPAAVALEPVLLSAEDCDDADDDDATGKPHVLVQSTLNQAPVPES